MVRIAVLDDALARVLAQEDLNDVQVVWSGDDVARLLDEGVRAAPDVIVLDAARLGADATAHVRAVRGALRARIVITTYTFARRADVDALRTAGSDFVLQGPLSTRTLRTFLLSLLIEGAMKRTTTSASTASANVANVATVASVANVAKVASVASVAKVANVARREAVKPGGAGAATPGASSEAAAVTPPLFSRDSLVRLREVRSAVACECPNHLADLVERLQAFEQYSKECEDRDDEDARVHRALWFATARARRMMEDALVELARHEGLSIA